MTLLEEELERAEERLKIATEKMEEASVNCDESERYSRLNLSIFIIIGIALLGGFLQALL